MDHTKWMILSGGMPKVVHIHKKLTQAEQDEKDEYLQCFLHTTNFDFDFHFFSCGNKILFYVFRAERIADEIERAPELANTAADKIARWHEHVG